MTPKRASTDEGNGPSVTTWIGAGATALGLEGRIALEHALLAQHLLRDSSLMVEFQTPQFDLDSSRTIIVQAVHTTALEQCFAVLERVVLEQQLIGVVTTDTADGTLRSRIQISRDALNAEGRLEHLNHEPLDNAIDMLMLLHRQHVANAVALASADRESFSDEQPATRLQALFDELAGPVGLTRAHPTFRREHVMREIAIRSSAALTVLEVAALCEEFLAAEGILLNSTGPLASRRYTTNDMLASELRVVSIATQLQGAGIAQVDSELATSVLDAWDQSSSGRLNDERRDVLQFLTTSGNGVDLLIGSAGAGKTNLMEAARDIWGAAGIPVIGTALRPVALGRLAEKTGIPTIALNHLLDLHGPAAINGAVVVVDEAASVGTRMLDRLFRMACVAGAKVVLVGDPHQIAADDAAGAIPALEQRLENVQRLTGTRRQKKGWERSALLNLRSGDVRSAIDDYAEHKRIVLGESTDDTFRRAVAQWLDRYKRGADTHVPTTEQYNLLLAGDASIVAALKHSVRDALRRRGELSEPNLICESGEEFAVGDDVILMFTASYLDVRTGTLARIREIHSTANTCTVQFTQLGRDVRRTIPLAYLHSGQVTHAYAMTVHDAQALKVSETMYVASPSATREEAYTALSRGTERNTTFVVPGANHIPGQDLRAILGARFERSRAARMALDVLSETTDPLRQIHLAQQRIALRIQGLETRLRELDDLLQVKSTGKKRRGILVTERKEVSKKLDQLNQRIRTLATHGVRALAESHRQTIATTHREFAELNTIDPVLAKCYGDLAERYSATSARLAGETIIADHVMIDVGDGVIFEADFLIRHPQGVYVKEVKAGKGSLTRAQRTGHPKLAQHGGTILSGTIHDPASINIGDVIGPTPIVREIWR